ncbi:Plasma membrane proteolipid 3 [Leucoagaricus sp. SymC.cos]|nr:Plasma membrane proteolipid 3 [Leucoagaricus sp. SymC.cos]
MALTASDICKARSFVAHRNHQCLRTFQIIFAIIFPPLGVFLERGCGADLLINILLTILGYMYVMQISNSTTPSDGLLFPCLLVVPESSMVSRLDSCLWQVR